MADPRRPSEPVSGVILAGGKATRLGGVDKAALVVGGETTLARARAALVPIVSEMILVVNDDRFDGLAGVRLVRDPEPHAGVLPALGVALERASCPLAVLVACDMPFLNPRLLRWLVQAAEQHDAVVPVVGGREQPMHAVYRTSTCRPAIARAVARGDRRMISFLSGLRVRRVDEPELRAWDPELRSFFNVNTPEDVMESERIANRRAE